MLWVWWTYVISYIIASLEPDIVYQEQVISIYLNIHNGKIQPWKYSNMSTICETYLHPISYINEKYPWKKCRNEQKYCTSLSTCQGVCYRYFFTMLWNCCWHKADFLSSPCSVYFKTTCLSCKECLGGYRYEKAAVISEHHINVGSSEVHQYQTQQRHHFVQLPGSM